MNAASPTTEKKSTTPFEEWGVYQMNDFDWWLARSVDEAREDYRLETGVVEPEPPQLLSDAQLRRLQFTDGDEFGNPRGRKRSFLTELKRRAAAGIKAPEMFATTET